MADGKSGDRTDLSLRLRLLITGSEVLGDNLTMSVAAGQLDAEGIRKRLHLAKAPS